IGLVFLRPGAPAPQGARFVLWLFFAVLAVLMFRLMPLFAIVAGPITALNLAELLAYYTRPAAGGAAVSWAGPARLARLVSLVLIVALVFMAWPGWLNGPI